MAEVSNYSQHPCGPQWLMYSRALGGAVRRRTPLLLLCSLAMLDGSAQDSQYTTTNHSLRVCNCPFFSWHSIPEAVHQYLLYRFYAVWDLLGLVANFYEIPEASTC